MDLNLELVIRIQSSFKLIQKGLEADESKEVHFLRMEGQLSQVNFWNPFKVLGITKKIVVAGAPVSRWFITDIDHHLKGNPHI